VNDHAPDSDGVCGLCHASRGIAKQSPAKTASLIRLIDGEAGQNNYRNRIGHVPPESARSAGHSDCSRSQSIVANHPLAVTDHKRTGSTAGLICAGPAFQPTIQCCLAAGKAFNPMVAAQRLGRRKRQRLFPRRRGLHAASQPVVRLGCRIQER